MIGSYGVCACWARKMFPYHGFMVRFRPVLVLAVGVLVTNKLVLLVNRLDFTRSRSLMRVRGVAGVGLLATTGGEEKPSQQMLLRSCCYLETKKMQQIGHKILSI